MARLTFNNEGEPHLSNLVRSGEGDALDNTNCVVWSDGLCVDHILRLFHAQMDGTISIDENKYVLRLYLIFCQIPKKELNF